MMAKHAVGIDSFALNFPKNKMTVDEVAQHSNISKQELKLYLGFDEKYVISPNESVMDLALTATKNALTDSSVNVEDINCIIVANTGLLDYQAWSSSAYIQQAINASDALTFDVQNGCNSLTNGMFLAKNLLVANINYQAILLVVCDVTTPLVNYSDIKQLPFFANGDGVAALIIRKDCQKFQILSQHLKTDGKYHAACRTSWGGLQGLSHWNKSNESKKISYELDIENSDVKALRDSVIANGYFDVATAALADINKKITDIDFVMLTQHTAIVFEQILKKFKLQRHKFLSTINSFGHVGSIDPLIGIQKLQSENKLKSGDLLLISTAGTGYHWGAQIIQV